MTSASETNPSLCPFCGRPTQRYTAPRQDGTIETWDGCVNRACAAGPSGVLTIKTVDAAGRPIRATKFTGSAFHDADRSAPSQGEDNVEAVAWLMMDSANRQFGTSYDQYHRSSQRSQDEAGYDCVIMCSGDGSCMRLQVTRALPPDVYRSQRQLGGRNLPVSLDQASTWVMEAIRRKATRASSDVALVLDGTEAQFLGFLTDMKVASENREELESHGWHSIWVVGPTGARQLAGRALPGATA